VSLYTPDPHFASGAGVVDSSSALIDKDEDDDEEADERGAMGNRNVKLDTAVLTSGGCDAAIRISANNVDVDIIRE
jgi:hypothetical protein